jgi:hypothetical protein
MCLYRYDSLFLKSLIFYWKDCIQKSRVKESPNNSRDKSRVEYTMLSKQYNMFWKIIINNPIIHPK